jgi:hypothetical protein
VLNGAAAFADSFMETFREVVPEAGGSEASADPTSGGADNSTPFEPPGAGTAGSIAPA